jgi:hypothetical protein
MAATLSSIILTCWGVIVEQATIWWCCWWGMAAKGGGGLLLVLVVVMMVAPRCVAEPPTGLQEILQLMTFSSILMS